MEDEPRSYQVPGKPGLKRKIRKGTFSCWECKRRKRRCELDPNSSACLSCQRHGVSCTSQKVTEVAQNAFQNIGERIDRVEALVSQLVQQRERQSAQRQELYDSSRQLSVGSARNSMNSPTLRSIGHESLSRGRSLNGYLFSILPHPATSAVILSSSSMFYSPLQISQGHKENPDIAHNSLPCGLQSTAHPVLFARRLIQLALCLKQFDASTSKQLECQLSDSVNNTSRRYHEIASRFVLSQNFLVDSLDGIETLILQARYHITIGDTRMAWAVQHRAINIALSIGVQQQAETKGGRAEYIWFQLVYSDVLFH